MKLPYPITYDNIASMCFSLFAWYFRNGCYSSNNLLFHLHFLHRPSKSFYFNTKPMYKVPKSSCTSYTLDYENVYLPKNHFIREEALETEQFLDYFYPFKKPLLRKRGVKYTWEVEGDTDAVALELTFSSEPTAKKMSFQKEHL